MDQNSLILSEGPFVSVSFSVSYEEGVSGVSADRFVSAGGRRALPRLVVKKKIISRDIKCSSSFRASHGHLKKSATKFERRSDVWRSRSGTRRSRSDIECPGVGRGFLL